MDHVPAARPLTTLDRDDLLRELCAASIAADRISAAIALLDREIERTDRHTDPLRHLHVRLTRAELAERIGAPLDFQLYEEATASVDALREAGPSPLKGPALSALGWYLRWRDPDLLLPPAPRGCGLDQAGRSPRSLSVRVWSCR